MQFVFLDSSSYCLTSFLRKLFQSDNCCKPTRPLPQVHLAPRVQLQAGGVRGARSPPTPTAPPRAGKRAQAAVGKQRVGPKFAGCLPAEPSPRGGRGRPLAGTRRRSPRGLTEAQARRRVGECEAGPARTGSSGRWGARGTAAPRRRAVQPVRGRARPRAPPAAASSSASTAAAQRPDPRGQHVRARRPRRRPGSMPAGARPLARGQLAAAAAARGAAGRSRPGRGRGARASPAA